MSEPRHEPDPANDPRSGTFHHPEFLQFVPAEADRTLPRWFWVMLAVMALSIVGISIARYAFAAEGPHVITVYFAGKDYDQVRSTQIVLGVNGAPAIYESRETCNVAITRVRVHLSGARLQCNPQR